MDRFSMACGCSNCHEQFSSPARNRLARKRRAGPPLRCNALSPATSSSPSRNGPHSLSLYFFHAQHLPPLTALLSTRCNLISSTPPASLLRAGRRQYSQVSNIHALCGSVRTSQPRRAASTSSERTLGASGQGKTTKLLLPPPPSSTHSHLGAAPPLHPSPRQFLCTLELDLLPVLSTTTATALQGFVPLHLLHHRRCCILYSVSGLPVLEGINRESAQPFSLRSSTCLMPLLLSNCTLHSRQNTANWTLLTPQNSAP